MRRILLSILSIIIYQNSFSQKSDYDVLKALFNDFNNFHPYDSIRLYENPLNFDRQETFFTNESFKNYTYPVIGVDTPKIVKLMKKVNFEFLRNNKRNSENWDVSKLPKNVILYAENSKRELNGKEQYKISKPIYTKDEKIAFIYSYDMCGFMDCSNFNIRVYKKIRKKWVFYAYIPITI